MKKNDFAKINFEVKSLKTIFGEELIGLKVTNPLNEAQVLDVYLDEEIDKEFCKSGIHPLTPSVCPKDFKYSLSFNLNRKSNIDQLGKIIHPNPKTNDMSILYGNADEAVLLSLSKFNSILDLKEHVKVPILKEIATDERVYMK